MGTICKFANCRWCPSILCCRSLAPTELKKKTDYVKYSQIENERKQMKTNKVDKFFLVVLLALVVAGFFIFISASFGLLTRNGADFGSVLLKQFALGIVLGGLACFIVSKINYKFWKRYSLYIFLGSILITLLVFIPHFGISLGGAKRWIPIGSFTFQPVELLKIGFIIYFAAWLSGIKDKISSYKFGLFPLLFFLAILGAVILSQPDTDTFIIIASSALAMYLAAGGRWRDIGIICGIGAVALSIFFVTHPYALGRIETFLNPDRDPQGSSYQIQQSLIAVGSGGIAGRGFGQSIQKFKYLPEPIGDSIFAVEAEEFGFLGGTFLIILFVLFAFSALRIASRAPDSFSGLLIVGIVILIVSQSFMNIGAMVGVLPLSGLPLIFVSHGGTALLFALIEAGIILNISKYQKI
jgi:cell division protein FtsW